MTDKNHDQDDIRGFVAECREGLDRIDSVLVALESEPGDRGRLDAVFRALHTIKGNAGFLGLPKLGAVANAGETLLGELCGGRLLWNEEIADLLLRLLDAIRIVLADLQATGSEGASEHDALTEELAQWAAAARGESSIELPAARDASLAVIADGAARWTEFHPSGHAVPRPERALAPDSRAAPTATFPAAPKLPSPEKPTSSASRNPGPPTGLTDRGQGDDSGSASKVSVLAAEPENSTFVRVQIDHLDELMNLVGELVLARNRIVQIASSHQDSELTEPIQRLNRLTTALQDGVMRTRMQPVRNAWRRYPRIVRDLAKQCGKQCELELQGGDTELDKSMLEAIADPLVHLVRNAIDHGIEKPYLRKIKGKPETGRLLVRAFQESGQVHVEIADDGAGLDLERIRRKAIEAGVISPERALEISETDLRHAVFLPGFTTKEHVTSLAGRGVGMDVVKTCVEQIGGTIELRTQQDVGTTIRLTVPLTLAIVPAIMVSCGEHRLAIPRINVVEMLRLRGDEMRQACDYFHDTPVLRLRGGLLPMADLSEKLGVGSRLDRATRESLDVVVLKTGTRQFAILVDEIRDAQEIVVKPLGELLASQTEYSGAALMGDGGIALILDVLGIARSTGLLTADQSLLGDSSAFHEAMPRLEEQILVCRVDGERQIALPLADVLRLEQVRFTAVEHSATGDVLQYCGGIVPLYPLSRSRRTRSAAESESDELISIVMFRTAGGHLGLLVDRIVDVAPRPAELQPVELAEDIGLRHRTVATGVVLGRVTDFLQVS